MCIFLIYINCNGCKIQFKEKVINDYFIQFIDELTEYDSVVNKFFLPMIQQKFDEPREQLEKVINNQKNKLERIKKAYVNGLFELQECNEERKKDLTKISLTEIQYKMRNACVKSYNKFYELDTRLKEKQKGRNQDINVKDMSNYKKLRNSWTRTQKKLAEANNQTEKLDNSSKDINSILDKLKLAKCNKNNNHISNENVEKDQKIYKRCKRYY